MRRDFTKQTSNREMKQMFRWGKRRFINYEKRVDAFFNNEYE